MYLERFPDSNGDNGNGKGSDNNSSQTDDLDAYRALRKRKALVARRYVTTNAARIDMLCRQVCSGDRSTMTDYDGVVGPVPTE